MLDSEVDINKLVKVYLKIRNAIDERKRSIKKS